MYKTELLETTVGGNESLKIRYVLWFNIYFKESRV